MDSPSAGDGFHVLTISDADSSQGHSSPRLSVARHDSESPKDDRTRQSTATRFRLGMPDTGGHKRATSILSQFHLQDQSLNNASLTSGQTKQVFGPGLSHWQDGFPAEKVAEMSSGQRKQLSAVWELITTERDYVKDLIIINDVHSLTQEFLKPIYGFKALNSKQVSLLFGNLEQILGVHVVFLQQLEAIDNLEDIKRYTDTFVLNSERFMCYIPYCANQQSIKQNLGLLSKSEIKSFLKEIVKHVDVDHSEFQEINRALERMQNNVKAINECARRLGVYEMIVDVQLRFAEVPRLTQKINIANPNRFLVREDVVYVMFANSVKKSRKLFLFNDLLILCRKDWRDKNHVIEKTPLKDIRISDIAEASGAAPLLFELEVLPSSDTDSPNRYIISTANPADKSSWLEVYKGLVKYTIKSKNISDIAMTHSNSETGDDEEAAEKGQTQQSAGTAGSVQPELDFRSRFEVLEQQLDEANLKNQDLTDRLNLEKKKYGDKDKQINEQQAALEQRAKQVKELESALAAKDKDVEKLREYLKSAKAGGTGLGIPMPATSRSSFLSAAREDMKQFADQQKEKEILDLKRTIDDLKRDMNANLEVHETKVSKLNDSILEKDSLMEKQYKIMTELQLQSNYSVKTIQETAIALEEKQDELQKSSAQITALELKCQELKDTFRSFCNMLGALSKALQQLKESQADLDRQKDTFERLINADATEKDYVAQFITLRQEYDSFKERVEAEKTQMLDAQQQQKLRISTLESQLSDALQTVALKQKLNQHTADSQASQLAEAKFMSLQTQMFGVKKDMDQKVVELDELKALVSVREASISQLEREKEEMAQMLDSSVLELKTENSRLTSRNTTLDRSLAEHAQLLVSTRSQLKKLETEIFDKTAEYEARFADQTIKYEESLSNETAKRDKQIILLQAEIKNLQLSIESNSEKIASKYNAERELLEAEHAETLGEIIGEYEKTKESLLNQHKIELNTLEERHKALMNKVKKENAATISSLKEDLLQSQSTISNALQDNEKLKQEIASTIAGKDEAIAEIQAKLVESSANIEAKQQFIEALESKLASFELSLTDKEKELGNLAEQFENIATSKEQTANTIKELSSNLASKEELIQKIVAHNEQQVKEQAVLLTTCQRDHAQLLQEHKKLSKQYSKTQETHMEALASIERLEKQRAVLYDKLKLLESEVGSQRSERQKLQLQQTEMQKQLQRMRESLDSAANSERSLNDTLKSVESQVFELQILLQNKEFKILELEKIVASGNSEVRRLSDKSKARNQKERQNLKENQERAAGQLAAELSELEKKLRACWQIEKDKLEMSYKNALAEQQVQLKSVSNELQMYQKSSKLRVLEFETHLEQAEEANKFVNGQLQEYTTQNSQLKIQLELSDKMLAQIKGKYEALLEDMQSKSESCARLQEIQNALETNVHDLRIQLEHADSYSKQLRIDLDKAKNSIHQKELEATKVQEEYFKKVKAEFKIKMDELSDRLQQSIDANAELKRQSFKHVSKAASALLTLNELGKLFSLSLPCTEDVLVAVSQNLKDGLLTLEDAFKIYPQNRKYYLDLVNGLDAFCIQKEVLVAQLESAKRELAGTILQKEEIERKLRTASTEYVALEERRKIQELESKANQQSFSNQLNTVVQDNKSLYRQLEQLQKRFSDSETQRSNLECRLADLCESSKIKHEALVQQLQLAQSEAAHYKNENISVAIAIEGFKLKEHERDSRYREMDNDRQRIIGDCNNLQKKIAELQKALDLQNRKNHVLLLELKHAHDDNQSLFASKEQIRDDYHRKLAKWIADNAELKADVGKLKAKLKDQGVQFELQLSRLNQQLVQLSITQQPQANLKPEKSITKLSANRKKTRQSRGNASESLEVIERLATAQTPETAEPTIAASNNQFGAFMDAILQDISPPM